jgi:hypothetical protein
MCAAEVDCHLLEDKLVVGCRLWCCCELMRFEAVHAAGRNIRRAGAGARAIDLPALIMCQPKACFLNGQQSTRPSPTSSLAQPSQHEYTMTVQAYIRDIASVSPCPQR